MFADLALASVAVIEPLQKAILVYVLDAPATRARVPERVLSVARVPADPAHVLLLLLLVLILRRRFSLLHTSSRRRRIGRRRSRR